MVTTSIDQTFRVWDAESGREIAVLNAHVSVNRAYWLPDRRRIVTVGADRFARIWDVSWTTVYGDDLREKVCAEKLIGIDQQFTDEDLIDPILSDIDRNEPGAGRSRLSIGRACRASGNDGSPISGQGARPRNEECGTAL